jgi:hypothetical protein
MGVEQLYFIIGFLVGVLLMGAISIAFFILYNEWVQPDKKDDLFD